MFAVLLIAVLTGIYLFVEHSRVKSFFDKLNERALTVAQFYLAEDNLSKENFKKVLNKYPQSLSRETIRIYDDKYQPKFIPQGSVRWDKDFLESVTSQKKVFLSKGNTQVIGIYYVDNSGTFIIVVSATDVQGYHDMRNLALIMFFFFLASLIITFVLGRIFARVFLMPIVGITNNLKKIKASSLDLRLPFHSYKADEIDILSLTINQLLEHLEQSFESQKSFVANASHELRTPITTILGEAEISLKHERKVEDYKQTLNNIIKETDRLNDIINSLMELIQTNIENTDFQSIRMDELCWEIVEDLSRTEREHINVKHQLTDTDLRYTLLGNRKLLFIAIGNILKNALKFSDGKEVLFELFYDSRGINLLIRDHGIGIHAKDIDKIFQPFFRSPNALSYPGYGIGLSLTNNIIRLHSGSISVRSEVGKWTQFHIVFPIV
jgi:signal transduction histidine kinase